ncbi:20S proteasome subunit A/B (plasmid) [Halorussus salilacus]|uniref:20S proteasome subunit A/B n=1 Tax=Halorussus salilacus TaxID=2953750 RepID=UPI00209EEE40|nr:20S proteasome subunit A/B [Halorussus salilacus]USZ69786.1 20S proteasome subunit A/B [Halorussus salilacus]
MATILGIEVDGGAVIAGDRLLAEGGTVRSENERRVFDFGDLGAAAVGDSGDVDEFERRLESEVRDHETQHGDPMTLTRFASLASDIAGELGVEAVVVGRDDREVARVRAIGADGGVLTDPTVALGSGAQVAAGILDGADRAVSLDAGERLAREVLDTVAERDTGTGGEVDAFALGDDADRLG